MTLQRCTLPVKTSARLRYSLSQSSTFAGFRKVTTKSDANIVSTSTISRPLLPTSNMLAKAASESNPTL